jgi:hypothetical protein
MDKRRILEFLEELIDALTFRRFALMVLLSSLLIGIFTLFEHRSAVFTMLYQRSEPSTAIQWQLSNESKNELIRLASDGVSNGLVGIVLVSDVDLRKNRRSPKFIHVSDSTDAEFIVPFVERLLPQAMFDYDQKNTEQMVEMLNNRFRCDSSHDTHYARFFPQLGQKYPVACRIAVPPFFGEFAGFIAIILTRQPTPGEFDSLKIEMNRLAIEVYLRDIIKKH